LNPLIKVMNLVSLLILPVVITNMDNSGTRYSIAIVSTVVVIGAILFSKRGAASMADQ
jgi:K(+)-stimulated pyrophosphate-energized sodium pump